MPDADGMGMGAMQKRIPDPGFLASPIKDESLSNPWSPDRSLDQELFQDDLWLEILPGLAAGQQNLGGAGQ